MGSGKHQCGRGLGEHQCCMGSGEHQCCMGSLHLLPSILKVWLGVMNTRIQQDK